MTTTGAESKELRKGFAGLPWLVHKFGGTSVANADCFRLVAGILEKELSCTHDSLPNSSNKRLAVVVSAMGGKPKTTDLLLQTVKDSAKRNAEAVEEVLRQILLKHETCVHALFPNAPATSERLIAIVQQDLSDIRDILKTVALMKWQASRISELVSGYGELWSTQILAALLQEHYGGAEKKHVFVYLDARRVITVDEEAIQDGAIVWDTSATNMERVYQEELAKIDTTTQHLHWVMTGYVASNTEGVATTLQRDGSDYSAAILGRLLTADAVTIWTDVHGVLSADPRRVPLAQVVPEVSYNEAMELAYFGAKVLHPKTMQPAIHSQIPIYIRNTFDSDFPGSRIFTQTTTTNDQVVCAFSSIDNMAIVNVEGSGLIGVPGVAKRLFATLERVGVNVVLISQASSEHSITFATTEVQAKTAKAVIEEEFRRELEQSRISHVDVKGPCSIIAAVGDRMSSTTGCAGRFFSALGDAKVNIIAIAQGCSERNISAVVRSEESVRALRAVHAAFQLSDTTFRIAIIGMNEVGQSLVRLMDAQRGALRANYEVDLQVCVVLPKGDGRELVCLKYDTDDDDSADSITIGAINEVTGSNLTVEAVTSFQDERDSAKLVSGGAETILEYLWRSNCTNHVVFDCTNDETIGKFHAEWLRAEVDVVTANNTGLSGSKAQRNLISLAEKAYGKQSAKYLREVTVGGGLPVIKTLRTLLNSGDQIRRIDGILSVSLSYIMFRISPPPEFSSCSDFDERTNNMSSSNLTSMEGTDDGSAVSFSDAVKDAIALGLMEEDPTKDLNNEYTCRVLMVLARELGMANDIEVGDIQKSSEKLLEVILHREVDYHNLSAEIDEQVKARVDAAKSRGCVLRHIASVDMKNKTIEVKVSEVPEHHIFAVTPPSCECVRFFTQRHRRYPLIVQGPSAGADSTASALLAELLHLVRGKTTPRSVALSRTDSLGRRLSQLKRLSYKPLI